MAKSTRSMRKGVLDRDILPAFNKRFLGETHEEDLRALCLRVRARGAPDTVVQVRDLVKQIYGYANPHGKKAANPADSVDATSIATFVPKDRALSPQEIQLMSKQLEFVAAYPTIRLALRMILLTLARKSELIEATWDEVDLEKVTSTIPKQRMRGRGRTWFISHARRSTFSWRCIPVRPVPTLSCRRATTLAVACPKRP